MRIPVQSIRLDGDTQSRDSVNQIIVNEYADDMREGAVFPPVVVFDDGDDIWLSEGFHRLYAARQAARTEIEADVRKGTRRDAQRNSMQSNATHGARRTNADKRRAVEMAFRWLLEEGRSLEGITNVEVAKMAAVDEKTAARARGQIVESLNTIPEKSDEPRINGVSSSAEIERLQVELAAAEAKAREIEALQRKIQTLETLVKAHKESDEILNDKLDEEKAERDREKRELVKALNEAQAKAAKTPAPKVIEKPVVREVVREVVPEATQARLKDLEAQVRKTNANEQYLRNLEDRKVKLQNEIMTLKEQATKDRIEATFEKTVTFIQTEKFLASQMLEFAERGELTIEQVDQVEGILGNVLAETNNALIALRKIRGEFRQGGGLRAL